MMASLSLGLVASVGLLVAALWVPWLAWLAAPVALVGGGSATWAALQAKKIQRTRLLDEAKSERSSHRERLRESHAAQREVLTIVKSRSRAVSAELTRTRADLGLRLMEVSQLQGDLQAIKVENADLRDHITYLRANTNEGAEVLSLPRRRSTDREDAEWSAGDAPTIVDLDLLRSIPQEEEYLRSQAN